MGQNKKIEAVGLMLLFHDVLSQVFQLSCGYLGKPIVNIN